MDDQEIDIDEIIEGKLWLGSFSVGNIKFLKDKGIKKILTVMNGDPSNYSYKENGFTHKIIDIMDYDSENIIQYFGECLNFIKGEDKVFIHCAEGESRSATIVIAYLMWNKKMTFDKAYNFVKSKRSRIYPNFGFRQQLQLFEKELIKNEYNIDKINFNEIQWTPKESYYDF